MANVEQDTEITLGTGRVLALFFGLVLVCAVFFAVGFSLGRKAAGADTAKPLATQSASPAAVVRPAAGKNDSPQPPSSDQFSFYKAVEQKNADAQLAPAQDSKAPAVTGTPAAAEPARTAPDPGSASGNAYFVQVAAVSRQEDADALVEALKKKQYPAFTANNASADKFYHVQVGPFLDIKEAEAMRGKLIGDGYNPILKK